MCTCIGLFFFNNDKKSTATQKELMLTKQALYARHVEGAGKEREIKILLTPPPLPLIYS